MVLAVLVMVRVRSLLLLVVLAVLLLLAMAVLPVVVVVLLVLLLRLTAVRQTVFLVAVQKDWINKAPEDEQGCPEEYECYYESNSVRCW